MAKEKGKPAKLKPVGGRLADRAVGLEYDARRTQRLEAAKTLHAGRTPLQVVAVAEQAAALVEGAIAQVIARHPPRPPLACREGCAWCCYKRVGTSAAEVVHIMEYLRRQLSAEEFQAFRQRVLRRDDERRVLAQDRWAAARVVCPLLVEDRCTAYPARPLTCRGFNSSDVQACERSVKERGPVEVPVYAPQHRLATFALDGMRAGMEEAGLKAELLELTAALRVVLEVPQAVERWLRGEPVFAQARMP
jgi:Fe-S-cluster containining protein